MELYCFNFQIITVDDVVGFEIKSSSDNDVYEFTNDLLSIFAKELDGKFQINNYQVLTPEIRVSLNAFIDKYKARLHSLNALEPFFRKLNDGDSYFVFPDTIINTPRLVELQGYLQSLRMGIDFEVLRKENDDLFGQALSNYIIGIAGPKRRFIGEKIKANRFCRFCKEPNGKTTFNNRSHAISEALGNKTLILFEECDRCNEKFSITIEPDIIEYYALFRSIFKIMGKGGLKKHEGKNFKIIDMPDKPFTIEYVSKNASGSDDGKLIELISDKKINHQNIYKSLCKFFISVIPSEYVAQFAETIDWINGDKEVEFLPRIAEIVSYHSFSTQPKIAYYIRNNKDVQIPYAVGEFYFACKILVFIVPLVPNEKSFFSDEEYAVFWETFQHYKRSKGWVFADFSSNEAVEFSTSLEVEINRDL